MAEFVLKVQDIDDRGKDYRFPMTGAWLDSALSDTPLRRDPGQGEGLLQVHAQRNGSEILIRGQLQADLLVECARCLGDAPLPVRAAMTALLSPASEQAQAEELDLDSDDVDRVPFVGNELILDDLVREHLLLETPMQPLCSPDCRGIQVPERVRPRPEDFGGSGIDPRLRPLQQLRGKLSGNKE